MAWRDIAAKLPAEPEAHYEAYHRFAGPAWEPAAGNLANSNLAWLRDHVGVGDYPALHAWSIEHRADFWGAMVQRLGLRWTKQPTTVLAGDAQQPLWFPGGALNAVDSCFLAPKDHVAIVAAGEGQALRSWTYGELHTLVLELAAGLRAKGLAPGDAVALYMPMNTACVALYLAIVHAGMTVISIPDSFAPAEVATRLRLGGARAIATVPHYMRGGKAVEMASKAEAAAAKLPIAPMVLVADDAGLNDLRVPGATPDAVAVDPYTPSNILFSSGTTGEPKAIPWNHLTPIKAAVDGHLHQDIQPTDVVAWPTNIGWMMGPWLIYASLMNRATLALYEGVPMGPDYLQFLRDAKVSVLGLVPAIVRAWKIADVPLGALPGVRIFSSTGEASNERDYLYLMGLANYEAPVIEYCGGTEIGGGHLTGSVLQPQWPARFTTAAMGLDFVLLQENEILEGPGMGEIFLVPPSVGLSQTLLNRDHDALYYDDVPRPDGRVLRRHGDEVERLANGTYRAQGRADDTMNLGGIKVGSIELETVMNAHPGIVETAAVAIPPPEGGAERLVVFAVTKGGEVEELRAALQRQIKTDLNPLFRIHDVVVVKELPRTASNKVMRRELRAQYKK